MKRAKKFLAVFALVFFASSIAWAQDTLDVRSEISEVTVYPDSALVSRLANLKLSPGDYKIIFGDIIPMIDENSLRVSSGGSAELKILGALLKKEFLEEVPQEEVKKLQDQIQELRDQIRSLEDLKRVLSENRKFLDSVRLFSGDQIPKDLVTRMPPAKDLEETLNFLDRNLQDNYSRIQQNEIEIRDIYKEIDMLNRKLSQISGPARKQKRSIEVEIEVERAGEVELVVSFLVYGASWQPIYDARADFDKAEVELVSFGIISQNTGEDWNDVNMVLSTAKPTIGGRMPYVSPWFIRPYQPEVFKVQEKVARKSRVLQFQAFDAEAPLLEEGLAFDRTFDENRYATAEEKGIAVVYRLPKKARIKSDGTEHKLAISTQVLKADFEYSSVPRLAPYAYLGSRVTNAKDLQLLAGRVNIFLEGDYVGTSSIDNIGPGEEFDLYLGVDESVKVKREQIKKTVDQTLVAGIPSPKKVTTYEYKLSVENYKSKDILVKLFENIPISEDDRIKVKILKVSQEPQQKDWKDRKGVWLWDLELAPKEKLEIFYSFSVEHPRNMQVEGLY